MGLELWCGEVVFGWTRLSKVNIEVDATTVVDAHIYTM